MAEDRLLTQKEFEKAELKERWEGDLSPILKAQDTKTANYYETVVIPQKIKELIEEIFTGIFNLVEPMSELWDEVQEYKVQLKQKRGM